MKIACAFSITLILLAGGCSKNDNPSAPADTNVGAMTRIYVNPASGSDGNAGTDSSPLKTIRKAMALAKAGQRVELQAGTYDAASGQTYPDTIPNGVVVEAVSAGLAVLVGPNQIAFVGSGNDTTRYLSFQGFQTVMRSASGIHVANAMSAVNVGYAFDLSGTAQGVVNGCTLSNSGVGLLTDIAQLTVNSSTISGQPGSDYFAVQKAATLLINGSTMSDAKAPALDLADVSVAALYGCTISKVSLQGAGGSSSINVSGSSHLTLRSTTISGAYGPAVFLRDAGTRVVAKVCNFIGNGSGNGYPALYQSGNLDVDSCNISGATSSGFLLQEGSLTIRNSTVQSMKEAGISASAGTSLYMRNTTVSSCQWGVLLNGATGSADLGTAASGGGNTFINNSQFGLRVSYTGGFFAYAYGNTWLPSTQGTNANGHYGTFLAVGPIKATAPSNYYIDSNANIQF